MFMPQGALSDGRPLLMAVAPAATAKVKAAAAAAMAAGLSAALRPDGMVNNMLKEGYMLQWRAVHCMAYMVGLGRMHSICASPGCGAPAFRGLSDQDACVMRLITHAMCVCQAALDAVCGATSAAHLMAYDALLQSWNAAGATLQFCTKVMRSCFAAWAGHTPWGLHLCEVGPIVWRSIKRLCCAMQWLNDPKTLQRVSTYLPAQFEVVDPATQPRFARNTIFDDVSEAIAKVGLRAADLLAAQPD